MIHTNVMQHKLLLIHITLLSCLFMGHAVAQTELTVNLESDKVKTYLDAVTYTYGSASRISSYAGTDEDEHPTPVVIELPIEAPTDCCVHIENDNNPNDSITIQIAEGSTSVEVYNLTPRQSYTYFIKDGLTDDVIDEGVIRTEGRVRMLHLPTIHNVRDMGGWRTADGQDTTRYGLIFRGGTPDEGSDDDHAELLRLGIRAELDMRTLSTTPTESSIGSDVVYKYIHLSDLWTSYVPTQSALLKECFEFVVENLRQGRPVYIHCTYGADRTGVLAAMISSCIGVSASNVYKDYELTSFADTHTQNTRREKSMLNTRLFTDIGFRTGKDLQQVMRTYMVEEMGINQTDIDDLMNIMLGLNNDIGTSVSCGRTPSISAAPYDITGRQLAETSYSKPCGIIIEQTSDGKMRKVIR